MRITFILAACFAGSVFGADQPTWNGKAAADYLDGRMNWWMGWSTAARDHGTFCVSCHTVAPYAMARPVLRSEEAPTPVERKLIDNVAKRVRMWTEVEP